MKTIVLSMSAITAWVAPFDFNPSSNLVECYGAGAGGKSSVGGGGGSYARSDNVPLAPGSIVEVQVGAAGAENNDGGDTWFCGPDFASAIVSAKGGKADTNGMGGLGGDSSLNIGTTKYSGGNGAPNASTKQNQQAGGGGGGAGPDGVGGNASGRTGGAGNGGVAGHGATGAISPTGSGVDAGQYGGGGAVIGVLVNAAAGGAIVISYEPVA